MRPLRDAEDPARPQLPSGSRTCVGAILMLWVSCINCLAGWAEHPDNTIDLQGVSLNPKHPTWSPKGDRIAFYSQGDIWIVNSDGSHPRNITSGPGSDFFPSWSPDGRRIVFDSNRDAGDNEHDYEIYIAEADGSATVRVHGSSRRDRMPDWSPDGKQIAFMSGRDGEWDIWVMNLDGSGPVNVTPGNGRSDTLPSWSPDGSLIAFLSRNPGGEMRVYVIRPDGTGERLLTEHAWATTSRPSWSPDGSQIAFGGIVINRAILLTRTPGFLYQILAVDVASGVIRRLRHSVACDYGPSWHPTAALIVYSSYGAEYRTTLAVLPTDRETRVSELTWGTMKLTGETLLTVPACKAALSSNIRDCRNRE